MVKNVNVTKTHSIRGNNKKLMGDVMKENKSTTSNRRRLKRGAVVDEETVKVVVVERGEDEIDVDVTVVIE